MTGYIYKVSNNINNKVYIGQTIRTIQDRWKQHMKDSKQDRYSKIHFYRALNKYGINEFYIEEVENVEYEDLIDLKNKLNELEMYYINKFNSFKGGYNSSYGGEGNVGLKHSEASKEKMRQARIGTKLPDSQKRSISLHSAKFWKGKKMPKDVVKKISIQHKIPVNQYDTKGNFIKLWDSCADVERVLKINHANITKVCKGKEHCNTAGGFIWKYANIA